MVIFIIAFWVFFGYNSIGLARFFIAFDVTAEISFRPYLHSS
jgi:hypothetical protein